MSADNSVQLRRGLVLHALHDQYPLPLTAPALSKVVGAFYLDDSRGYTRDLAYLEESGLLVREAGTVGRAQIVTYKLTPAGVDLVEGVTQFSGVEVMPA